MKAANPERSKRLQRVDKLLSDRRQHSTLDIIRRARVCAVSAIVSELRQAGRRINCTVQMVHGQRVWFYKLVRR